MSVNNLVSANLFFLLFAFMIQRAKRLSGVCYFLNQVVTGFGHMKMYIAPDQTINLSEIDFPRGYKKDLSQDSVLKRSERV